jgi:hypothetical protein
MSDHSVSKQMRSRRSALASLAAAALISPLLGCRAFHRWRHRHDPVVEDSQCVDATASVKRRVYVICRGPASLAGPPSGFGPEVVAALNALPGFNAILLPPNAPLEPPPNDPNGPPLAVMMLPDGPSPTGAIDEILLIEINEMQPFRPMRLCAVLERRSAADGVVLSREHRAWNAPADMEPLYPSHFNRMILNHPPSLGEVEQHELSRLSPVTFFRNVAGDVAREMATRPY